MILQNAPRDVNKLEQLLKIKERQKEEAMHIADTQWLFAEIEMLSVVLYLVNRNTTPGRRRKRKRRKNTKYTAASTDGFFGLPDTPTERETAAASFPSVVT
jgi:hypothetical protein